ncbi:MAG: PAS domain-containing protein, partial [Opitutaceae bacterium]
MLRRLSTGVGCGLCVLATSAFAGSFSGGERLVTLMPNGVSMGFVTAVLFLICGLGFIAYGRERAALGRSIGVIVACFAAGILIAYGVGNFFQIGVFADHPGEIVVRVGSDGRMSPSGGLSFAVLGLSLFFMGGGPLKKRSLVACASALMAISFLTLGGYFTGLRWESSWWRYTGMAVHTAGAFLGTAVFLLVWVLRRTPRAERLTASSLLFFVTAGSMVAMVAMAAFVSSSIKSEKENWVRHSREVRSELERVTLFLARLDMPLSRDVSQNGNADRDLEASNRAALQRQFDDVESLVRDNPVQLVRLRELRQITARLTADAAIPRNEIIGALREAWGVFQREEKRLLEQRELESLDIEQVVWRVLVVGRLGVVVLMGTAFILLYRSQKELQEMNASLEERVKARTKEYEMSNESLRQSEQNWRFLADTMPQLVWTARPDGTMESVNQGWSAFMGVEPAQALAATTGVVHPDDLPSTKREWAAMMREERTGIGECRLRRADGVWRWHLWRAHPQRDDKGVVVRWVGTSTDVHDQKTAAETLELRVRERTNDLVISEARQRETT